MSDNNFEQRCAIKFCFRLGHSATETFNKLREAYGDCVLSRAQVFRWFKAFSEGRDSIEDEPRSGRPSTARTDENVEKIRVLVRSDRRLTVRMIGEELNLTHTTVHQILINELGITKVCAKMVPKNLSQDQKDNRTETSLDFLGRIENDPNFLERVITGDETWIFEYDLSPCDFFLFPRLKIHLKGHHFGTLENIEKAVTDQLKAIPVSEFQHCYEEWKNRLQRCVASQGNYFEGDNVEL